MKSTYMTVDPQNGVLHGHCGCCCLSMFCDACRVAGAFDDAFLRSVSLHLIEDCTSGFLLHLRKDPPSHHSLIPPATLSCFEWLRTSTPMDRLHPLTRVSSTWPNLCSLPSAVELYPVRAVKRMMMNSERMPRGAERGSRNESGGLLPQVHFVPWAVLGHDFVHPGTNVYI